MKNIHSHSQPPQNLLQGTFYYNPVCFVLFSARKYTNRCLSFPEVSTASGMGFVVEGSERSKTGWQKKNLARDHNPNTELLIWFQTAAQDDSLMKFRHQQGKPDQYCLNPRQKKTYCIVVVSRGLTTHKIRLVKILSCFWA